MGQWLLVSSQSDQSGLRFVVMAMLELLQPSIYAIMTTFQRDGATVFFGSIVVLLDSVCLVVIVAEWSAIQQSLS